MEVMSETHLVLPQEIYLKELALRAVPLDIGRLSIAGFTDLAIYLPPSFREEGIEPWAWPYPLLLLDGQEASERLRATGINSSPQARYYGLEANETDRQWQIRPTWHAQISFPTDGRQPSSYSGNANWPSTTPAYFFPEPIDYEQAGFKEIIYQTLERVGLEKETQPGLMERLTDSLEGPPGPVKALQDLEIDGIKLHRPGQPPQTIIDLN